MEHWTPLANPLQCDCHCKLQNQRVAASFRRRAGTAAISNLKRYFPRGVCSAVELVRNSPKMQRVCEELAQRTTFDVAVVTRSAATAAELREILGEKFELPLRCTCNPPSPQL